MRLYFITTSENYIYQIPCNIEIYKHLYLHKNRHTHMYTTFISNNKNIKNIFFQPFVIYSPQSLFLAAQLYEKRAKGLNRNQILLLTKKEKQNAMMLSVQNIPWNLLG